MYCDVPEAVYYLNYQSPASLYRLIKAGLLEDYVEMHDGHVFLRMGFKGRSPTLASRNEKSFFMFCKMINLNF